MNLTRTLPQFFSDTGQKKTPDKKDGRRMSFQKPRGTIEYSVSYCFIVRMSLHSKYRLSFITKYKQNNHLHYLLSLELYVSNSLF